ncbi:D-arabinono-1,4-lactone oxidase [Streptomyces sp. NPDC059398]|uniref:D-arabinono-1,4-lactone oxidase n=1 Tax=Streptomyces sp. NPDC059398 TaxID=3346820 RepID=UPI0036B2FF48
MKNWAGNIDLGTASVERPASLEELRHVVARGERIRALGAGHSFSGILATGGTLVRLDGLPPEIRIDAGSGTVTVGAGVRYAHLSAELHEAGYALANLASLPDITVAGAAASATHGSGDGQRCLAASVAGVELVGPEGDLTTLRRDVDGDAFTGSVVSLGALGVTARLTLEIEPSFEVAQSLRTAVSLDELCARFDEAFGAAYSVSAFTLWRDDAVLWLKRRTDRPATELELGALADGPLAPVPGDDPSHCTPQAGLPGPWHERLPHTLAGSAGDDGDELQSEYFLPREAAPAAFAALQELSGVLAPVLQVSEVRTVRGDDLWLSPAHERDSVTFHFTWTRDLARVRPVIEAVEERLAPLGARPHWAKLTEMSSPTIRSLYRRAPDFTELRTKADPDGKFGNQFIDEVFPSGGPTGVPLPAHHRRSAHGKA